MNDRRLAYPLLVNLRLENKPFQNRCRAFVRRFPFKFTPMRTIK
jgi:hypothetical protein